MMKHTWLIFLLPLALLLSACEQTPVPPQEEHPFSQEEQVKKHLDEAFAEFCQAIPAFESQEEARAFILNNSWILPGRNGTIRYWLQTPGSFSTILLDIRLDITGLPGSAALEASLLGGLKMAGTVYPGRITTNPHNWESAMDIHIYDQGMDVATLGVEVLEYKEAGVEALRPVVVFRFPDGTSYSITSLLLIEPLIDFLLKYVLGTL